MTTGFVLLIISGGWLVLGHSQVKNEGGAALAPKGPCIGTINITALPSIKFTPVSLSAKTGIYCVTLTDAASAPHTLDFDDPATLFPGLEVSAAGEKVRRPHLLRQRRRVHVLLRDPRPPGGRHAGRRERHRADHDAGRGRDGRGRVAGGSPSGASGASAPGATGASGATG